MTLDNTFFIAIFSALFTIAVILVRLSWTLSSMNAKINRVDKIEETLEKFKEEYHQDIKYNRGCPRND